nr:peroxidase 64-like [Ipomoea batatas]
MARPSSSLVLGFVVLFMFSVTPLMANALSSNYYDQTCPKAESVITGVVKKAMLNDRTVPAALLRMHFHDCFIRGCDGSVLLKSSGGPQWDVPKGRKDGRISKATDTRQLPSPTFNITQLRQNFAQRGLSMEDLVALSGGHSLGFSHCSSFQNRIHNFDKSNDVDPSLKASFAASLRKVCPVHNKVRNAGATMDSSSATFDNAYYKLLLQGKSLFSSDQALITTPKTKALVSKYANSQQEFYDAFARSMIKMSSIAGNGQEIRSDCRFVN